MLILVRVVRRVDGYLLFHLVEIAAGLEVVGFQQVVNVRFVLFLSAVVVLHRPFLRPTWVIIILLVNDNRLGHRDHLGDRSRHL